MAAGARAGGWAGASGREVWLARGGGWVGWRGGAVGLRRRAAALYAEAVAEYPRPSSEGRAANMRAIRRTDTKPEIALRREVARQGDRFRQDYRIDVGA